MNKITVWILVEGNRPAEINGLAGDILDGELGTPIFLSEEHADSVRYINRPKPCGCCYDLPYLNLSVRKAKLTLEVL